MARFSGFGGLKRTPFSAHTLECPQLGAKLMGARALQHRCSHIGQLPGIKCAWSAWLGYGAQCINAALIKKCLSCVDSLTRYSNSQSYLGAALAFLQHASSSKPPFCQLASSLFRHLRGMVKREGFASGEIT
jgi:hypothetical protein